LCEYVDNKKTVRHTKVSTTFDNYVHAVSGTQEKVAAVMDEITTPVALPEELTAKRASDSIAPQGGIAPGLP